MRTYRFTFAKRGALIFVSHLDFSHSVVRALKRAHLPIKYSEGFSPHPKLVFGLPLSVGMTGENELLDVTLVSDDVSNEDFKARFAAAMTNDMEIKDVSDPGLKLGKIKSADYTVYFESCPLTADEINEKLENLPPVVKKTKSGAEKLLDISPMVFAAHASESDCKVSLELTLSSSGDAYLNPELVIQSLALSDTDYSITRTHINFSAEEYALS